MTRSYVTENSAQRARLRALVDRLTDAELARPLDAGWTVAAVLASLAVFAPAAVAVPVAQHTSARAAACHRTLKHYPVLRPGAHRPAVPPVA